MKVSTGLIALISLTLSHNLLAAREKIVCTSNEGFSAYLDFNPKIVQDTIWRRSTDGDSQIVMIEATGKDSDTTTSAKVSVTVPKDFMEDEYTGKFSFKNFYSINTLEEAGSGYSERFDNKTYRGFHGDIDNGKWDMMIYVPNTAERQVESYPGLLTLQDERTDMGYYHIDVVCSSHR